MLQRVRSMTVASRNASLTTSSSSRSMQLLQTELELFVSENTLLMTQHPPALGSAHVGSSLTAHSVWSQKRSVVPCIACAATVAGAAWQL
jgi:hypothetical protein